MQRLLAIAILIVPPLVTVGCPVYDSTCDGDGDCAPGAVCEQGACFIVRAPGPAPGRCHTTDECPIGLSCDRFNRCVDGPSGAAGEGGSGAASGAAGAAGQSTP